MGIGWKRRQKKSWTPKQKAGSLGGKATAKKYGKDYMKQIASEGGKVTRQRYRLVPANTSGFLMVYRDGPNEGQVKATCNIPEPWEM